jgi:hypothetical protein
MGTCLTAKASPGYGRMYLLKSVAQQRMLFHFLFRGRCLETNVSEPFTSSDCFSGSTVIALNKYATILSLIADGRMCVMPEIVIELTGGSAFVAACCPLALSDHLNRLGLVQGHRQRRKQEMGSECLMQRSSTFSLWERYIRV